MIYGKNINLNIKNGNNKKNILNNINFEIPKSSITCFVGKNGSGKTTLLRCLINLQKKYTGTINFEHKNLKKISNAERAKQIGFVFQELNLFNNLTVLQNCTFPLMNLFNMCLPHAEKVVLNLLVQFDIENIKDKYPSKLSYGQKQKVAIVRTLAIRPKILILDEPSSSLDLESKEKLANILFDLNKQKLTIVLTSHDTAFVDSIYNRAYFLEDGHIVEFIDRKN